MINRGLDIFQTDDDEDDREFFRDAIATINRDIKVAQQFNGTELLAALNNSVHQPDLIFLDLNMPVKNGFEVLKEMRLTGHLEQIPVIVLSTSDSEKIVAQCRDLGASLYIVKPNSYEALVDTLKSVLAIDWKNPANFNSQFLFKTTGKQ